MPIIPNQKELENLLKDMPQFPATITSVLYSPSPPFISWLFFKYDNSGFGGQMELLNSHINQLRDECDLEHAVQLEKEKITVYTPSIESGVIYAVKSVKYILLQEKQKEHAELIEKINKLYKKET